MHVGSGSSVCHRSIFFFSLSSPKNYNLVLFLVGISTSILILFVFNFLFLALLYKFYLFSNLFFNPNLLNFIFLHFFLNLLISKFCLYSFIKILLVFNLIF